MRDLMLDIVKSWSIKKGINDLNDILSWVKEKNDNLKVLISKNSLDDSDYWYYDKEIGSIVSKNRGFFSITGLQKFEDDVLVQEQPIILQEEIGYLGIICKKINGVIHFLMQAKIEPGNINKIQLSPTIQATKSNFTQKHGGKKPAYLEYFINSNKYKILVDQIQSEQSSRFLKKRNRNIIIYVDEDIEVLPSHKWMTLGQIKSLMKVDNLVNMDTRTVLSGIPYSLYNISSDEVKEYFNDDNLCKSIFNCDDKKDIAKIYNYINNYKMFDNSSLKIVPLYSLSNWSMENKEFISKTPYDFKVVFCDISIEGREVKHWTQPLFEATGIALFGLIMANYDGKKLFLVNCKPEIGSMDKIEIGPTIQLEPTGNIINDIYNLFCQKLKNKDSIKYDVLLSEEGGRFYHEQNRNVIVEIDYNELKNIPEGYFWVDYKTINLLQQVNNTINIQLRNLLSLLEV